MSDIIDQTDAREEALNTARIENVRRNAILAPGQPGECDRCGDESPRLVHGACAPCRDKFKLP